MRPYNRQYQRTSVKEVIERCEALKAEYLAAGKDVSYLDKAIDYWKARQKGHRLSDGQFAGILEGRRE